MMQSTLSLSMVFMTKMLSPWNILFLIIFELFAGTKSFSKVMKAYGHSTLTLDNDPSLNPDFVCDLLGVSGRDFKFKNTDLLWASPPCQGFSVAAIGRNWNYDNTPKTDSARLSMALAMKTLDLIKVIKPKWWFIENPRGKLRKMPFMDEFLIKQGGGKAHSLVLSVWRFSYEADRHLDERNMVDTSSSVQERRSLSRICTTRSSDWYARHRRGEGSRSNSAGFIRGDTSTAQKL